MCSVREATRSRSIEAGMGAVALMKSEATRASPLDRCGYPPTLERGQAPFLRSSARRTLPLRERVGELHDARVLVGRGLRLHVVLQLARERVGRRVAVLEHDDRAHDGAAL